MNVSDINLIELSKRLSDKNISKLEIDLINKIIWHVQQKPPAKVDVIMVLGFPECVKKRLPKAISLYHKYDEPYMLLSGGVVISDIGMTEAEAMCHACLRNGILEEKLLIENQSSTTNENIKFSAKIINETLKGDDIKLAVVSSATHLRRVMMNFQRYRNIYTNMTDIFAIASDNVDYEGWINDSDLCNQVSTELRFIHEYIYELGYDEFTI